MIPVNREARIHGALWGSLVGDALGVPVEFQSRDQVRKNPVTGLRGFGTHNQPTGTWSDDSSLLLCTVDSLATCQRFDATDLGERFARWKNNAYWSPHGSVFDIGIATSQAISRIARGVPPEEAGGDDEYSNGNGSLMRIVPMALWFASASPSELATYAARSSALTHRHPRSQMACAMYCLLVCELLAGTESARVLRSAWQKFSPLYQHPPFATELSHFQHLGDGSLENASDCAVASSGYVMHTLTASIWCLLTSRSLEETVLKAVNLGSDTDTTGTVAGGLAGARYGVESIPQDWRTGLARFDDVALLFDRFAAQLPSA